MRAPVRVIIFLCVGLVAASQSGNIIRIGDASPVVMSAWRLLLATLFLLPIAGRDLAALVRLSARQRVLLVLTGAALACHLFAWIGAVQLTTVANASVFFSCNPVITALGAFIIFRERANARLAVSIALGVAGAAVIAAGDLYLSREHLAGDAAAFLSAVLFSTYFLIGKKLRALLPASAYVAAIYGVAACVAFAAAVFLRLPLVDYTPRTWLCFALLAIVPTLLGHTSFNVALRYLPVGTIAAATMTEPFLGGLVAYVAWHEPISLQTGAGYVLISLSVIVLTMRPRR